MSEPTAADRALAKEFADHIAAHSEGYESVCESCEKRLAAMFAAHREQAIRERDAQWIEEADKGFEGVRNPLEVVALACTKCGASGVKLWRQYQTFLEHIRVMCTACAEADQKCHRERDSIGWMVPAVPTDDGTFWGFTSVPEAALRAWRALPECVAAEKAAEERAK